MWYSKPTFAYTSKGNDVITLKRLLKSHKNVALFITGKWINKMHIYMEYYSMVKRMNSSP